MYSFITLTALGLLVGGATYLRTRSPGAIIGGGLVGLVAGFVMSALLCGFTPYRWTETGTWKLRSMNTIDGVSGTFVWGTGSLRSETAYRVLIVNDNGSVSPLTIAATVNNTEIFEQDTLTNEGEVTIYRYMRDRSWWGNGWALEKSDTDWYSYKITVPKGSVRNEFTVQ
jgi:hypothetical protein